MNKATDLLLDAAGEVNGYRIGTPFRICEFSLVAVVPITRDGAQGRNYKLISEVKDSIKIRDTGNIDKVEVINTTDTPVLIKAGEVVVGSTQSRTFSKSQVLLPKEKVLADCCCVHSSYGIKAGQQVKPGGYSPTPIRTILYSHYKDGDFDYDSDLQHKIWSGVRSSSRSLAESRERLSFARGRVEKAAKSSGGRGMASGLHFLTSMPDSEPSWQAPLEDLAGRLAESQKKFEVVLKQVPKVDNQVGLCLIGLSGPDNFELFNHPDSWSALRDSILRSESAKIGDMADQDGVFTYSPEKAREVIKSLLTAQYYQDVTVNKERTQTLLLTSSKVAGEVVTLDGEPIHCTLLRKAN